MRIITHRLGEAHDPVGEARALESLEPYIDRIWQEAFDGLVRDFCRGKHRAWCRKVLFDRMSAQQRSVYFPTDDDLVAELNSVLSRDVAKDPRFNSAHARFWLEDLERREVLPQRVWAAVRGSIEATASHDSAEFICELVGQAGSRKELQLLDELMQKGGHFSGIPRAIDNAAFAVCVRVLD
jgi:hypothetical protein